MNTPDHLARSLFMRRATLGDSLQLYKWRNSEDVRIYSRNSELISFADHEKWLEHKLAGSESDIYIFSTNGQPCGTTRLDFIGQSHWEISVTVDSEFRKLGLGKLMIEETCKNAVRDLNANVIEAHIHRENIASIGLFQSIGFKEFLSFEDYVSYKLTLS